MSRVAKKPINLPKGVECSITATTITLKGPKGSLSMNRPQGVELAVEAGVVQVDLEKCKSAALAGTIRALINNMAVGVSESFARKLELVGVGYRANMAGSNLNLSLGFSHPVLFTVPAGITIETPTQTEIWVKGNDKQLVGEVAAKIRAYRPPEPYKGKGVRYAGERIVMKEAKKA